MVQEDYTALVLAIRAALERVRSTRVRHELDSLLALLLSVAADRSYGLIGVSDLQRVRAQFRSVLSTMTAADRDSVTDELVLAITFALDGKVERASAHLRRSATVVDTPNDHKSLYRRLWPPR